MQPTWASPQGFSRCSKGRKSPDTYWVVKILIMRGQKNAAKRVILRSEKVYNLTDFVPGLLNRDIIFGNILYSIYIHFQYQIIWLVKIYDKIILIIIKDICISSISCYLWSLIDIMISMIWYWNTQKEVKVDKLIVSFLDIIEPDGLLSLETLILGRRVVWHLILILII